MYCRNCGSEIDDKAVICVKCGVQTGIGRDFCYNCGSRTEPGAIVCLRCGAGLTVPVMQGSYANAYPGAKSKMAAGLLGIFLGSLGVHNFYLGYTGKAAAQLTLTIVGILTSCIFVGIFFYLGAYIWGLVEGIMILTGSINVDADGCPLRD